jgi:hypothetical protein
MMPKAVLKGAGLLSVALAIGVAAAPTAFAAVNVVHHDPSQHPRCFGSFFGYYATQWEHWPVPPAHPGAVILPAPRQAPDVKMPPAGDGNGSDPHTGGGASRWRGTGK